MADAKSRRTIHDLLRDARSGIERPEPSEALAAQQNGALVIDTRSSDERAMTGVIAGSLHIPRSVLEWRLDPAADPAFHNPHIHGLDQQLILVCAHGESSSLAAASLRELGFSRATDLAGGFTAWVKAGLPVQPAPEVAGRTVPGMGDPAS